MNDNMSAVDYAVNKYNQAYRGSERDRKEMERMQGIYTAFGKSQWSTEAKNTLMSRGSIVPQINLTRGKIDRLAGSIIKNFFDVKFVPVSSAETPLTRLLNDVFVAESNMFDYDKAYLKCVTDALIHCGVEQMKLSTRYNALGDITFEHIMPGKILLDPHWTSDDSWDLENVWKVAYLTPQQVVNTYNHRNREIKELVSFLSRSGYDYIDDYSNPSEKYFNQDPSYNNLYRVVEHHFLETVTKDVEFVRLKDNTKMQMPENESDGIDFLEKMHLSGEVENTFKRRITQKEYIVEAFCPELDRYKFLDKGKSDIQIGRLPFYPLSALRYGGHNAGMVSQVEDVQRLLNSREAKSDDIIAASADGSYLFDPMLFGNDNGLVAEAIKAMHIPGSKIPVKAGMLMSGRKGFEPIERQPYPGEFQYEIQRMESYFDKLTGQTATLDGSKESAHDTGVLFSKRAAQAEMALAILSKKLENHQRDKFESWFLYAKKVLSGPVRVFNKTGEDKGEREEIKINVRTYSEDGQVVIQNDFSTLKRHNVVVVPSKSGLTNRELDRSRSIELLNVVTDPIKRVILEQQALETLDDSEKQRNELRRYNDLSLALAVKRYEAEIVNLDSVIAQGRQQQLAAAAGVSPGGEGQPMEDQQQEQLPEEAL